MVHMFEHQSQPNQGESSYTKPAWKKAKLDPKEEDPLLSTLKFGLERVATALEKSGKDPEAIQIFGMI
ncbi:hypothetical protein BRADI_3g52553v3 [Brachypodium distachyon]|uniref:Uncharacterized protein n=1 Tax=Brachypodium distachyon TaxID=15368 RepID=A0A0Q3FRZ0_BRADI|nr:hypothetical protein BRADI_3g52553v3 [Brachypodium distachyon]PNT69278.1 hypothetical protein BRADI_3g52553v3 [Brachypodium distachyon]